MLICDNENNESEEYTDLRSISASPKRSFRVLTRDEYLIAFFKLPQFSFYLSEITCAVAI